MSVIRVDRLRALDSGIFVDIVIKGGVNAGDECPCSHQRHTAKFDFCLNAAGGRRGRNGGSEVGA